MRCLRWCGDEQEDPQQVLVMLPSIKPAARDTGPAKDLTALDIYSNININTKPQV